MRILIADVFEAASRDRIEAAGHEVRFSPELEGVGLESEIADFGPRVLVVRSTKVRAAALSASAGLELVVRAGAGFDNIDCDAAVANGVSVANCPGMNAVAVAELAIGHLINCDRRLADQAADLRAGRWNKSEYAKARGLKGLSLGVVGAGAIGRAVIQRARAFDMSINVWSRSMTIERAAELGARFTGRGVKGLQTLARESDAVTVHVSATPDTESLCGREFFGAMREGAYFVNTSRGSVVDEVALAEAIRSKGIRAGLDVFRGQPADAVTDWKPKLADLATVWGSHHIGASTKQAQQAVADEVVAIIEEFGSSGGVRNLICGPEAVRQA